MASTSAVRRLVLALLALALLGAACSSDASESEREDAAPEEAAPAPTTVEEGEDPPEVVVMARGDWATGHFQAAIFAELISELGYDVSRPADTEVGPVTLYPAMARGEVDVWANGWFPHHDEFLDQEFPSGGVVGDHVEVIGEQITSGGILGFLISKWWADDLNIRYVDDIGQNGDLSKQLDADGDGIGDILGCDVDWPCHGDINGLIESNDWRLSQLSSDYDELFSAAQSRVGNGLPTMIFAWGPSGYVGSLIPGEEMVWLGVRNPTESQQGPADLDLTVCLADPCETGFLVGDIRAVGNTEFLDSHADIRALLEAIEIPAGDVAAQNALMRAGEDSDADVDRHATEWIENHRSLVDEWLSER